MRRCVGILRKDAGKNYEIKTLQVVKNSALVMFLQNILCGKLESLVLLMIKITLYASSLNNRVQELF